LNCGYFFQNERGSKYRQGVVGKSQFQKDNGSCWNRRVSSGGTTVVEGILLEPAVDENRRNHTEL
jgi:hypothetical protein